MPKTETKYGAQLATKVTPEMLESLVTNAEMIGSTKDIVVRELVRAFNELCSKGRRPVFPLAVSSPSYVLLKGRIIDASSYFQPETAPAVVAEHAEPTTPPSALHLPGMTKANLSQTLKEKPSRVPRK